MLKRRTMIWLGCATLLLVAAACSGSKYSDAKEIVVEQAKITEAYVTGMEKAASGSEMAAAINAYTDKMKELLPKVKAYQQKYPELSGAQATPPAELEKEMARLEEVSGRVQSATMNMMRFMAHPDVQKAMQRMGQELGGVMGG
ncbi:MAG: hypothetical protein ABIL58_14780 [Pseudomonadota bacterium]